MLPLSLPVWMMKRNWFVESNSTSSFIHEVDVNKKPICYLYVVMVACFSIVNYTQLVNGNLFVAQYTKCKHHATGVSIQPEHFMYVYCITDSTHCSKNEWFGGSVCTHKLYYAGLHVIAVWYTFLFCASYLLFIHIIAKCYRKSLEKQSRWKEHWCRNTFTVLDT